MRRPAFVILLAALAFGVPQSAAAEKHAAQTPVEHLVVLMQENHTFDNYFGLYPGADGIPAGVCMPVDPTKGEKPCVTPFHIGTRDVEPTDPDHSQSTFERQYRGGRLDGFVHALNLRNQDGRIAMGYYDERDLQFYWNLARQYVLYDRFFSSAQGGSTVNHVFWVAGRAPPTGDRVSRTGLEVETIFDRLEQAGVSWKFYVQNYDPTLTYRTISTAPPNRASQVTWVPLLGIDRFLDDPRLNGHIVDLSEYYKDLENGTLPAVAYIAPSGPSEHPPSSIQSGQTFVRTLLNSMMQSTSWSSSAFLVAYDDWGGWYDHVKPPQVDKWGYGFRVPAFVVSPYARRGVVDHTVLDFTSILRFVEDNWRIRPLAQRDANANSIASAFDFTAPPRDAVMIPAGSPAASKDAASSPRTAPIYLTYTVGLACLVALLGWAAVDRTRRRRAKGART
jgi:phospholipase C